MNVQNIYQLLAMIKIYKWGGTNTFLFSTLL